MTTATRREALLGIPENVQAAVDVLLFAETRGPRALDAGLAAIPPDQTVAVLRALIVRHNMRRAVTVRDALQSLARAEHEDEARIARQGGNTR